MKRREFLKWSGLGSVMSLIPFSIFAKEKTYTIDDICDNTVFNNENLYYFRDNKFSKMINFKLIENGCIKDEFSFQYYLGFHENILPYKENYTEKELNLFFNQFIEDSKEDGFASIDKNKVKYPFKLILEEKHIWENQVYIGIEKIGYRFDGYCCRKDSKQQYG